MDIRHWRSLAPFPLAPSVRIQWLSQKAVSPWRGNCLCGTHGRIRTSGLPLRSFGWAVVLEIGRDRQSLVDQGWRAFNCSFEFVFFGLKSAEKHPSCLQDVGKSNKGDRPTTPSTAFCWKTVKLKHCPSPVIVPHNYTEWYFELSHLQLTNQESFGELIK